MIYFDSFSYFSTVVFCFPFGRDIDEGMKSCRQNKTLGEYDL